jgi:small subunit ribosomal protein S17
VAEAKQISNKSVTGIVKSDKMDKSIVVKVETKKKHKEYPKLVKSATTFMAHDEKNIAKIGDKVKIVSARPYSKNKKWRLVEIISEKY